MAFDPIALIRQHTREGYERLVRDRWVEARIWIQENGEMAAIAGLILGIFFVLAFRFVIGVLVLLAIAAFIVWQIALPEGGEGKPSEPPSSDQDPPQTH